MTSDDTVHPPRLATHLVECAASREESDGVLGDLAEEFSAVARRNGTRAARRWYWREARRTAWQLATSPLWLRPAASLMMALVGISLARAFGPVTDAGAAAVVTRYPVYWYVPASVFWGVASATGSLLAGFVLGLIAPEVRFRPISAAVAVLVALGLWLVADQPLFLLAFGPPHMPITLGSAMARWAYGMLTFGGTILAGAILARAIPLRTLPSEWNGHADPTRPLLWLAALSGVLIGATLIARYAADVMTPVPYTTGLTTIRSQMTTGGVIAAITIPAAYAAWSSGRALTGFVVGLSGGCLGGILSSVGVTGLVLLSHDPTHIRWANGRALGPFGDALLVVWLLTAVSGAVAGLCGRFVLRPLVPRT